MKEGDYRDTDFFPSFFVINVQGFEAIDATYHFFQ